MINVLDFDPTIGTETEFSNWTGGRTPASLGTNAGAKPLAFQNWRRFKEAFAPELIARAVTETSASLVREVKTCIDPFAGSGTTPLACQFLGVSPVAIEVNPYLADLIEAKLTSMLQCAVERRFLSAGAKPAQQLSLRLEAARAVHRGNDMD